MKSLLKLVRNRVNSPVEFGYGLTTADRYVKHAIATGGVAQVVREFQPCNVADLLKRARQTLVYASPDMIVEDTETCAAAYREMLPRGIEAPPHTLMLIRHVITTPRIDRAGDVLRSQGAKVDPKAPLLWQHMHDLPIGKVVSVVEQTEKTLRAVTALLDLNALTSDVAKLVEAGVLRFSHGFQPIEWKELEIAKDGEASDEDRQPGFDIKRFEVIELSLVSVPANTDAEIELFGQKKLESAYFQAHAQHYARRRKVQIPGASLPSITKSTETDEEETEGVEKSAVKYEKTPVSDATQWDGDAAERRVREWAGTSGDEPAAAAWAKHRRAFGRVAGDGNKFADFSYIHHDIEGGELVVNKGGVSAAIAAINGGRGGGTDWESEGERAAVYAMIAKHYADWDGEAPPLKAVEPERAVWPGVVLRPGVKGFDIESEHLEADRLEYDWASRFLGCEIKDMVVCGTFVPQARRGTFFTAEKHYERANQMEVVDTRNITHDGKEVPPLRETIQLNSKLRDTFLVEGLEFYKSPGWRLIIKHVDTYGGAYVQTYAKDDRGQEFIDTCWDWARAHNFLKGERFALTGNFLTPGDETCDDVFLTKPNADALRRAIRRANDKTRTFASRGMIFMGPPGTGKTMSGRVLMNQCDTTFIWVSAKDFWRTGAVGGICAAFELAAELAPTVLFFEDIDNWITEYAEDLVKTEMDGIAKRDGVLTVLTTNYPERLPDALIDRPGRFHDICEFHLPDKSIRLEMLRRWADGIDPQRLDEIAEKTAGYSGAHIRELCSFARSLADDENVSLEKAIVLALEKIDAQRELITGQQLAGSNYRPSQRTLDRYGVKALDVAGLCFRVKRGRVLSQRNLTALTDVVDDLKELADMDLTRAAKALVNGCAAKVSRVIEDATAGDNPEEEEAGKHAEAWTVAGHIREAVAEATPAQLKRLAPALCARLEVERLDNLAEEYRRLTS